MNELLISVDKAARMLSISRAAFYKFASSGRIGPMAHKLGRRTLYSVEELQNWIRAGMPARSQWLRRKK